jgi:hypothetical protein
VVSETTIEPAAANSHLHELGLSIPLRLVLLDVNPNTGEPLNNNRHWETATNNIYQEEGEPPPGPAHVKTGDQIPRGINRNSSIAICALHRSRGNRISKCIVASSKL